MKAGLKTPARLDLSNEHEDYLEILDDLSLRELGLLATLAGFEAKHPFSEDQNDLQRASSFSDDFEEEVCHRFAIPREELSGLMVSLIRTGTYEPFTGSFLGYTGGKGKLTGT